MPGRGRRLLAVSLAVLAAASALGACGGSGGGPSTAQDQAAIAHMLKTGLGTNDATVMCSRTLSAGLIGRVFGTAAQCVAVQGQAVTGRTPPTAVQVTNVRVDGDRGSATVRLLGGDEDGTAGALSLRREAGGWRVSDLSTAFLRSELNASVTGDPGLDRRMSACIRRALTALDDRSLRTMAFGTMSGSREAQQQVAAIARGCLKGTTDSGDAQTI